MVGRNGMKELSARQRPDTRYFFVVVEYLWLAFGRILNKQLASVGCFSMGINYCNTLSGDYVQYIDMWVHHINKGEQKLNRCNEREYILRFAKAQDSIWLQ
jgi:hypothetical protein